MASKHVKDILMMSIEKHQVGIKRRMEHRGREYTERGGKYRKKLKSFMSL